MNKTFYKTSFKTSVFFILMGLSCLSYAAESGNSSLATDNMLNQANNEKPMTLDERIQALEEEMGIIVPEQSELDVNDLESQVQDLKLSLQHIFHRNGQRISRSEIR